MNKKQISLTSDYPVGEEIFYTNNPMVPVVSGSMTILGPFTTEEIAQKRQQHENFLEELSKKDKKSDYPLEIYKLIRIDQE